MVIEKETNEVKLNNILKEYEVNMTIITETQKKLKDILDNVMIYNGVPRVKRPFCGVTIITDNRS